MRNTMLIGLTIFSFISSDIDANTGNEVYRIGFIRGKAVDSIYDSKHGVVCYSIDGYKADPLSCVKVK